MKAFLITSPMIQKGLLDTFVIGSLVALKIADALSFFETFCSLDVWYYTLQMFDFCPYDLTQENHL